MVLLPILCNVIMITICASIRWSFIAISTIIVFQVNGLQHTPTPSTNSSTSRRHYLKTIVQSLGTLSIGSFLTPTYYSFAIDEDDVRPIESKTRDGRPFAPREALLPMARLKVWSDKVYEKASSLSQVDNEHRYQTLLELDRLISSPPKLFASEKFPKRTVGTTAQITSAVSTANRDQYQMNRRSFNIGDKVAAMLNQADVERQWGMLQYAESKREESNEMRAAFNFYTQQLTFGDRYNLNASKEERKMMIRNDELPTLTAVITSDLDLRDLFRNQYLTAIDDLQAEVSYQAKQTSDTIDVSEIIILVTQANKALSQWFALISSTDVQEAIHAVKINNGIIN